MVNTGLKGSSFEWLISVVKREQLWVVNTVVKKR